MITHRTFFAFFVSALVFILLASPCPAKDPGESVSAGTPLPIHALGRLEPDLGVIELSAAAGEQRIQAVLVSEGQAVAAGEPLVRLVGYDAQKADLAWIEEKVRTAREQVARELDLREVRLTESQISQELTETDDIRQIKILEHKILSLGAAVRYQALEMERARALNTKEVVAANIYDLRQFEHVKAEQDLNTAKVELERQKIMAGLHQKEARVERESILAGSRARVLEIGLTNLEQEQLLSQKKLATYVILSPVEGEILTIFSRGGEVPRALPILKMADIRTMTAVAEVYETDLSRVRPGQNAVIKSPALPGKLTGKVMRISRLIFRRTVKDIDPYQPEDYRVAEVRIQLDDPETAARFIQLQVDVELETGP